MTFDFHPNVSLTYDAIASDVSGWEVTHFEPGHAFDPPSAAEKLVQVGMRAVLRDIQDYVYDHDMTGTINSSELRAYLLAQLIIAGTFDGQS